MDPKNRISVVDAMNHSYFDEIRDLYTEATEK